MLHWLTHAEEPVPPSATVALVDPDMFFLRPVLTLCFFSSAAGHLFIILDEPGRAPDAVALRDHGASDEARRWHGRHHALLARVGEGRDVLGGRVEGVVPQRTE